MGNPNPQKATQCYKNWQLDKEKLVHLRSTEANWQNNKQEPKKQHNVTYNNWQLAKEKLVILLTYAVFGWTETCIWLDRELVQAMVSS